jgi:hypothetical protein
MPNLEELCIEQDVSLHALSVDLTSIPHLHGLKKLSVTGRFTGHPSILYQVGLRRCIDCLIINGN